MRIPWAVPSIPWDCRNFDRDLGLQLADLDMAQSSSIAEEVSPAQNKNLSMFAQTRPWPCSQRSSPAAQNLRTASDDRTLWKLFIFFSINIFV